MRIYTGTLTKNGILDPDVVEGVNTLGPALNGMAWRRIGPGRFGCKTVDDSQTWPAGTVLMVPNGNIGPDLTDMHTSHVMQDDPLVLNLDVRKNGVYTDDGLVNTPFLIIVPDDK